MSAGRRLASDALFASSWMALRVFALVAWLWALISQLSAAEFGLVASFLSINAVAALLVQMGIPYLFFAERHSLADARDSSREALGAILAASPVAAAISTVAIHSLTGGLIEGWGLLLGVAYADILTSAVIQMIALRGHSYGRLGFAAGLPALLILTRLCAAVVAPKVGSALDIPLLPTYLILHAFLATATAAGMFAVLRAPLRMHVLPGLPGRTTLCRSWRYALMGGSSLALGEMDKPLITRMFGLNVAGHYALAYRVASTFSTPATALAASMIPRWSRMLHCGQTDALLRTFIAAWVSTAVFGAVIAVLLRYAVSILPPGTFGLYPEAWPWIILMVWLVPLIGMHQITSAALLALGRPLTRTLVDLSAYGVLALSLILGGAGVALSSVPVACMVAEAIAVMVGTFLILATVCIASRKGVLA